MFELNAAAKRLRSLPWRKMKEAILGKRFQASIALVSESEMRRVRRILRAQKKYRFNSGHALNVLSFFFGEGEGEILLNKNQIQKEAKALGEPFQKRIVYLYVHGLLHLKGYDHKKGKNAQKMEKQEKKFLSVFAKRRRTGLY